LVLQIAPGTQILVFCSVERKQPAANMADVPAPTPITEWPDYAVDPNGGNVMTTDLNALYDKGDLCWMLVSTVLCWYATCFSHLLENTNCE